MKFSPKMLIAALLLSVTGAVLAADEYNTVPAGDVQYKQCVARVKKIYEGGDEKSPFAGQNKAEAYCTCLWNETPENFTGGLSKFAESEKGKELDKVCTKYSKWE
jgi:hypothetical protein